VGGFCDGHIYVYFGAAGGFANATSPLVLSARFATGSLGLGSGFVSQGLGFDVGDFDGDGLADIVASATDCTTKSEVYLWTGAALKASRTAPAVVVLTDTGFIGGMVRAVGRVTGGTAPGDDLLLSANTVGCGTAPDRSLRLLPRGGTWTAGSTATLSFAQASITLPADHGFGAPDAAAIDVLEGGTSRQSLFVAFIDTSTTTPPTPEIRELRVLRGSTLTGTVALTSGNAIVAPTGAGTVTDFGLHLSSGLDATGDGKNDLALTGDKRVFLYDGTTLLSTSPQPVQTLAVTSDISTADVGYCAQLLPDLNGDGIGELSGCANPGQAPDAYFAFGGNGPALSFFPGVFNFTPQRGQRIKGIGTAFGQKIAAGHVSSKTGLDLVVLSETTTTAQLELLR
jgi:hypothetical protein